MKIDQAVKHFGSQKKLAETLSITESAISRWRERGDTVPLKSALKINNYTGGAVDLVLGDYQNVCKVRIRRLY